jgi:hypothetical protein
MTLGSTQALTEISTRNLTAICERIILNVGASTSHNTIGLHGLLQG